VMRDKASVYTVHSKFAFLALPNEENETKPI